MSAPAAALAGRAMVDGTSFIGRLLGPYVIQARLGAGGMGEVYRAHDTKLERDVAIKILPWIFTSDPERRARFGREARLLAALNHPNIGAIYGLEDVDGVPALVLELVEGENASGEAGDWGLGLGKLRPPGPSPGHIAHSLSTKRCRSRGRSLRRSRSRMRKASSIGISSRPM